MNFKLNLALKLILSAVVTFFVIKLWVFGVNDPNEPREWPYLMFDVVGWFALTYPLLAAVIALASEGSIRHKKWSMGIGLLLSLLVTCLTLFDGTDSIRDVGLYMVIVVPIVLIYSFVAASGLVMITFRFLVGLTSLMRYLALKSL
jgi:hypothetical protein